MAKDLSEEMPMFLASTWRSHPAIADQLAWVWRSWWKV
jgi:hypothetical protein